MAYFLHGARLKASRKREQTGRMDVKRFGIARTLPASNLTPPHLTTTLEKKEKTHSEQIKGKDGGRDPYILFFFLSCPVVRSSGRQDAIFTLTNGRQLSDGGMGFSQASMGDEVGAERGPEAEGPRVKKRNVLPPPFSAVPLGFRVV